MNKPVLFIDFDGTLCYDKFWRTLDPEVKDKISVFKTGMAKKWMKGEHTSEEINRHAAAEIGLSEEALWDVFIENCKTMSISQDTLKTIAGLRGEYHAVLITDNMDCLDRFTVPALGLQDYFDLIVNSYNEKAGKCDNNGASFMKAIDILGTEMDGSRLIDNSSSACKLFEELGGKSHFVDADHSLDYWLRHVGSQGAYFID